MPASAVRRRNRAVPLPTRRPETRASKRSRPHSAATGAPPHRVVLRVGVTGSDRCLGRAGSGSRRRAGSAALLPAVPARLAALLSALLAALLAAVLPPLLAAVLPAVLPPVSAASRTRRGRGGR